MQTFIIQRRYICINSINEIKIDQGSTETRNDGITVRKSIHWHLVIIDPYTSFLNLVCLVLSSSMQQCCVTVLLG